MGTTERREREREMLRSRIVEATRDILSEEGLGALSMRAIAERIEYSPATIYLYFKDKDELIREVVLAGLALLWERNKAELESLPETANALEQYAALGRAYVRWALENTAYFRVMFELPSAAQFDSEDCANLEPGDHAGFDVVVNLIEQAVAEGLMVVADAERTAVKGWAQLHGLVSLYLSGHLAGLVDTTESFLELVDEAIQTFYVGLRGPQMVVANGAGHGPLNGKAKASGTGKGKRSRAGTKRG